METKRKLQSMTADASLWCACGSGSRICPMQRLDCKDITLTLLFS